MLMASGAGNMLTIIGQDGWETQGDHGEYRLCTIDEICDDDATGVVSFDITVHNEDTGGSATEGGVASSAIRRAGDCEPILEVIASMARLTEAYAKSQPEAPRCKLVICTKPCHKDKYGTYHAFCGRGHARAHADLIAGEDTVVTRPVPIPGVMAFHREYELFGRFSNFYMADLYIGGVKYHSGEQAYQHLKALAHVDHPKRDTFRVQDAYRGSARLIAKAIMEAPTPADCKTKARELDYNAEYFEAKEDGRRRKFNIMLTVLRTKFERGTIMAESLLRTGDDLIVEVAQHDPTWALGSTQPRPLRCRATAGANAVRTGWDSYS